MSRLRPLARLHVFALVLAAVAAASAALSVAAVPDPERVALAIALCAAMTLAGLFPLPVGAGTKHPLDTAVLVAAVLLFEPGVALLVAGGGAVLAQALQRQPWDQALFNGAQAALLGAVGGGVLAAAGWRADGPSFDQPGLVLLAVAVGAMLVVLGTLNVATIVALQAGDDLLPAWRRSTAGADRAEQFAHAAQVGLGVLAAGIAAAHSWMVALLVLPVGALYQALAHHVRRGRAADARLVHQAYHDPLTDLPNRALLLDRLEQALVRADRRGELVGLLYLDLDRFKLVNDTLGHAHGDRLLVVVAERIKGCVRPGDTVARLGGDEFIVLLDGLPVAAAAEDVAARLAAAIEAPFILGGRDVTVGVSIGVALAEPGRATAGDPLRDADVALRWAKDQGEARWAVFDTAMGERLRERIALEEDLRGAIRRGELRLAYQPLVELATGRVVGAEALARWTHPTRGPVPPTEFIPVAEDSGLVVPLGEWALGEACRQAGAWQGRLEARPVVSVNVSPRQFQQPGLVDAVARALRASGLAPHRLMLEITETAVMAEADAAAATLRRLRDLGVGLAIDDFGTGYSSLANLQCFPVDVLKVDRRFVAALGRDEGGAAIVEAVLGLARALGMRVVAEGVETGEQAARLRELGCELAQGYYFARPGEPEAFEALATKVTYAVGRQERHA